jgi:hypothetical protein
MSERPVPCNTSCSCRPTRRATTLALHNEDYGLVSIVLGPAEGIALASDLLNAAHRRFSNLVAHAALEGWCGLRNAA